MSDITYSNKQTGDQVTAADMNEIKTAVNSKIDKNGTDRLMTAAEGSKLAAISGTNTGDQDLSGLAPINSPTFTGTVGGITKSMVGLGNIDNTSDLNKPVSTATQQAINNAVVGLYDDRGNYDASGNTFPVTGGSGTVGAVLKGDIWTISVAGTLGETLVTQGDSIRALSDSPGQTAGNWAIITYGGTATIASQAEAEAGVENTKVMTALRVLQSFVYQVANYTISTLNTTSKNIVGSINELFSTKTDKLIIPNRQTASYTLVLTDAEKLVEMNVATDNDLTVPPNSSVAYNIGTQIIIVWYGIGQPTIVAGSGVTVHSDSGKLKLAARYCAASLIKIGTDEWYLFGGITA